MSLSKASTLLGLKRGTVQLLPYNPKWTALFLEEKQLLQTALGTHVHNIQHIGSTAVPGFAAKPIIDMIVSVDDLNVYKKLIVPLQDLGYEYMPERMFADRKFFPKGPQSSRTHHLNLVLEDDFKQWKLPLLFRDYLRSHEETKDEYTQLKTSLVAKYGDDRMAYTKSKNDFIQRILQIASR